jgi:hypothetical protein
MERELWDRLYLLAVKLDTGWTKAVFRASVIVGVYVWAVLHDRPVSWACQKRNWPPDMRFVRHRLPSQPTMSRRLRSPDTERLLTALEQELSSDPSATWVKVIDAKPLAVGGHSKDADAQWGRAVQCWAKGYKVYAIWGNAPLPYVWGLAPLNVSEVRMAKHMIPLLSGSGYLLGDALYDGNPLHELAWKANYQLVAPQQRPGKNVGHRRHEPSRLRAMALLQTKFGKALMDTRSRIERDFAWLTNCAAGLASLPAWVRGLPRVRLWVWAKLLINAVRRPPCVAGPTTAVA